MRIAKWMICLVCATAAVAETNVVTPKAKTPLFNGQDFAGWVKFAPGAQGQVNEIWSVREGVIHCLGKPNGYIRTEAPYRDYRLHLEWRWVEKPTNSGVLLHTTGPDRVWPLCVEAQLMHENAGDFWLLSQSTLQVGGEVKGPGAYVNVKKRGAHSEKPAGEWNAYDITCDGGTVRLVVNGVLQNEGAEANPAEGFICLQSEGSPIEFRNVHLEPLAP